MQAQSQGVAPAKGMFSSFASIFREEGFRGLYRVNGTFHIIVGVFHVCIELFKLVLSILFDYI